MAVTLTTQQISPYSVLASWSSDLTDPTFYIYVNGEQVAATSQTSYVVPAEPGESVFIEVFDTALHTATAVPAGRATLCWYSVPSAIQYKIEELIDDEWSEVALISSDAWFLQWTTRYLEDCTLHSFRITPISEGDAEGEPVEFLKFIARYPDPPQVTFSYSAATGKLTVTI